MLPLFSSRQGRAGKLTFGIANGLLNLRFSLQSGMKSTIMGMISLSGGNLLCYFDLC